MEWPKRAMRQSRHVVITEREVEEVTKYESSFLDRVNDNRVFTVTCYAGRSVNRFGY
ncbi:uncharacterized protein G2W53_034577 [Senna tora]|uniref:Uncharacterized protein n=1 Tax=Senna tora TaxID=362788 RepID=A0A834T3L1_9FABA|nr:uncharacterized protein G2W53_034577 [Senna tora]